MQLISEIGTYEDHDALDDENHNKHGDIPSEGDNKESQNDLGTEIGTELRNGNHVDRGDYAYTNIEVESTKETLIMTKS